MPESQPSHPDPCCNRRDFLRATAAAGAVAATGGLSAAAAEAKPAAETHVSELFGSLDAKQKKLCTFPFDHPLQSKVDANWHITKARVGEHFSAQQQALIREIFNGLHSPEYAQAVMGQVEHDGGFENCSIALFGTPGSGKFEFVFTGRHVTRRCDGDSVAGSAFGGPIFYGHAAASFDEPPDHKGNAYWYQAIRANELFTALDGKQRAIALREDPRGEQGTATVQLHAKASQRVGLPVGEMSSDQKQLARHVMRDVLAPFRELDRQESMRLVKKQGFDNLSFAYYSNEDIGDDRVWDVWQIEGPAMVWYFRGSPHVHVWAACYDKPESQVASAVKIPFSVAS